MEKPSIDLICPDLPFAENGVLKNRKLIKEIFYCALKNRKLVKEIFYCALKNRKLVKEIFCCALKNRKLIKEIFYCALKKLSLGYQNTVKYWRNLLLKIAQQVCCAIPSSSMGNPLGNRILRVSLVSPSVQIIQLVHGTYFSVPSHPIPWQFIPVPSYLSRFPL